MRIGSADIGKINAADLRGLAKLTRLGTRFYLRKAGVAADRQRRRANEFHAVIVRRVMTCCHHDPAVAAQVACGKINLFGAALTDIGHVGAAFCKPAAERSAELLARESNIKPYHYAFG